MSTKYGILYAILQNKHTIKTTCKHVIFQHQNYQHVFLKWNVASLLFFYVVCHQSILLTAGEQRWFQPYTNSALSATMKLYDPYRSTCWRKHLETTAKGLVFLLKICITIVVLEDLFFFINGKHRSIQG